jgi:hypothetical protein
VCKGVCIAVGVTVVGGEACEWRNENRVHGGAGCVIVEGAGGCLET